MDALTRFLKDCGMVEVKKEYKYWDPARVGKDGSRRVPDVTCVNPNTGTEYVLDARIYWNPAELLAQQAKSVLALLAPKDVTETRLWVGRVS